MKVSPDPWQVPTRIPHHPPCYVVLITGVPCGICIRVQDSVRCILSRHCRHGPCKDRGDSSSSGESKESKHSEFPKCSVCSLRLTGMSYMSSNNSSGISAQPLLFCGFLSSVWSFEWLSKCPERRQYTPQRLRTRGSAHSVAIARKHMHTQKLDEAIRFTAQRILERVSTPEVRAAH